MQTRKGMSMLTGTQAHRHRLLSVSLLTAGQLPPQLPLGPDNLAQSLHGLMTAVQAQRKEAHEKRGKAYFPAKAAFVTFDTEQDRLNCLDKAPGMVACDRGIGIVFKRVCTPWQLQMYCASTE